MDKVLEWQRLLDEDVTRVTAMLQRDSYYGGVYMTAVGRGITGMTHDVQVYHIKHS